MLLPLVAAAAAGAAGALGHADSKPNLIFVITVSHHHHPPTADCSPAAR